MSSHREAPEISKDPVADGTDVYAFVSPAQPRQVCLIANFIPLQKPDGGPNFYEFAEDVLYEIHVSQRNDMSADVTYQFRFSTRIRNRRTFLYNTGPIDTIGAQTWNRPQYYTVTRIKNGRSKQITGWLPCPPVNVGPRSTPDYELLARQATIRRGNRQFYAGQRADAFHVDLGSIFDLGGLRPLNQAHAIPLEAMDGVNSTETTNIHTIALQVPIRELSRDGSVPTNPMARKSVIGVWATASRRKGRTWNPRRGAYDGTGPWVQVSRLANPLFNEVLVPMAQKDRWNAEQPQDDSTYAGHVQRPELAGLLPALYPGAFDNLAAYKKPRADLDAILLTGIPKGVVPGFQNYTGPRKADVLRLNMAIPASKEPNNLGLVAGDPAGFPNGRRVDDDVVTIELRAIAGATIPLVDPDYQPDAAVAQVSDGTEPRRNTPTQSRFPYLGLPGGGYQTTPGTTSAGQRAGSS